jgi:hypothetical protein
MGILGMAAGALVGTASLVLSLRGWPIERLWFYLLGAAMLVVVGLQLLAFWVITGVLGELSEREARVADDIEGTFRPE